MKPQNIIILFALLLLAACTTRTETVKYRLPDNIKIEQIKAELDYGKIVEVSTVSSPTTIKVDRFYNEEILVCIDSNEQVVMVNIDNIDKVWSYDTALSGNTDYLDERSSGNSLKDCEDNLVCHVFVKLLIIVIVLSALG